MFDKPEWAQHKPKRCNVCRDGCGFRARPCPGCEKQKVRTPAGYFVGLTEAQAQAYRDLRESMGVEEECLPRE